MAMSMPPPAVGGFSLRVQLFSSNAHDLADRPVRCFRVVTSPDVTIREFCKEASRIHEINYGLPLAIKKCQDDQQFDVTQSDIVGDLFTSMSTIRITQAATNPNVRDSIPPNSALRYDPGLNINRKREREGSARPNGEVPSNAWQPNKRQRVSDLDPDQPIPSRETDQEHGPVRDERHKIVVPDSQGSDVYAAGNGNSRHVRADIPETPPPESRGYENGSTDQQRKSAEASTHQRSQVITGRANAFRDTQPRSQISNTPRAKSASYHIQRATERGTSVSTAATSPLSGDQQSVQSESRSSSKRKVSDPIKVNGKTASRSPNEDSVYENIESDAESFAAVIAKTKASLKIKNRSPSGLPGHEWANNFNTPPNGNRRNARPQEQRTPSALPLTPSSREREENERLRSEAEQATKARKAAADAADQRRREAEEARLAEEAKAVEEERVRRREQDREIREKRAASIAKAAKLEQERKEKEAEAQRLEDERQAALELERAKEQAARLEKENKAKAEKEKLEAERLERERLAAEKAENGYLEQERLRAGKSQRLREEEALKAKTAGELRKSQERDEGENLKRKQSPASMEHSQRTNVSTPDRMKQTPIRPPQSSSTAFIPSGRKSALKSSNSQSSAAGSSPIMARASPAVSSRSGDSDRLMSNGLSRERRVSFDTTVVDNEKAATPIRPPPRNLQPPKTITPKPAVSTPKPATSTPVPNASNSKVVPIGRQSTTRILPPPSIARLSKERSTTPLRQSSVASSQLGSAAPATTITPKVVVKSASPASSSSKPAETPSRASKEKSKSVEPPVQPETVEISSGESESDSDSEEDIPAQVDSVKRSNGSREERASPVIKREPGTENDDEEVENEDDEDVGVGGVCSDSEARSPRSPVTFNQHTSPELPSLAPLSRSAKVIEEETQSDSDSDSSSGKEDEDEDSSSSEEEEESDNEAQDTTIQVPQSSPELPRLKQDTKPSSQSQESVPKTVSQPSQNQRKTPTPTPSDDSFNTQDEVDFQLTSSMLEVRPSPPSQFRAVRSTPIPPPRSTPRQAFSQGASLIAMSQSKTLLGSSSQVNGTKPKVAGPPKLHEAEEDSESEESDEESDSDSSEDEDNNPSAQLSQEQSWQKHPPDLKSPSETSSDDSDSEIDESLIARNELAASLAKQEENARKKTLQPPSQTSVKSNNGRFASQGKDNRKAGVELKTKKKNEKFLTNYQFALPP